MSLKTSYSDDNIIVEQSLSVSYSTAVVQGSWGWTSGNVSGTHTQMLECHRYANKSFRYVGMTFAAAKICETDMKTLFNRAFKTSNWNGDSFGGSWQVINSGSKIMASIQPTHDSDDAYDVVISVNEDDVRFIKTSDVFNPATLFAAERQRTYGSDGHGAASETET